jgi:hypothetical protein
MKPEDADLLREIMKVTQAQADIVQQLEIQLRVMTTAMSLLGVSLHLSGTIPRETLAAIVENAAGRLASDDERRLAAPVLAALQLWTAEPTRS